MRRHTVLVVSGVILAGTSAVWLAGTGSARSADLCSGPVTASFPSQCAAPLTAAQERELKPKDRFRECENCPEMVVLPAGSFTMGGPPSPGGLSKRNEPQHVVTIARPFAVGKLHVTVDQFGVFARETRYTSHYGCDWRAPRFRQGGSHPVVCVNWEDANAYVGWLAKKTGKSYRLLSEAEWEYAARGRTSPGNYPPYWFGDAEKKDLCRYGNYVEDAYRVGKRDSDEIRCNDGTHAFHYTSPAGHYRPNDFGLYDMFGNAWQWTADCWHEDYNGAPVDGSPWTSECQPGPLEQRRGEHIVRGGSYIRDEETWSRGTGEIVNNDGGFRVARTLTP
jgi:formylglycine-generating enzyme required for sulfatase activity